MPDKRKGMRGVGGGRSLAVSTFITDRDTESTLGRPVRNSQRQRIEALSTRDEY